MARAAGALDRGPDPARPAGRARGGQRREVGPGLGGRGGPSSTTSSRGSCTTSCGISRSPSGRSSPRPSVRSGSTSCSTRSSTRRCLTATAASWSSTSSGRSSPRACSRCYAADRTVKKRNGPIRDEDGTMAGDRPSFSLASGQRGRERLGRRCSEISSFARVRVTTRRSPRWRPTHTDASIASPA